jgi:Na+-transporting NADH:ubiquinone oxidoreductase subunit NqrF
MQATSLVLAAARLPGMLCSVACGGAGRCAQPRGECQRGSDEARNLPKRDKETIEARLAEVKRIEAAKARKRD